MRLRFDATSVRFTPSIRSWLARHSLSLACVEWPSPAFPKQGQRSRPMASRCPRLAFTDSFDRCLSASSVSGFGVRITGTRLPCGTRILYGFSPLPASAERFNASSPLVTPLWDVTPSGSGPCGSRSPCEERTRPNGKLASKLASTEHPISSHSPTALLLTTPPDHRSRFAAFRLALLFRKSDRSHVVL